VILMQITVHIFITLILRTARIQIKSKVHFSQNLSPLGNQADALMVNYNHPKAMITQLLYFVFKLIAN